MRVRDAALWAALLLGTLSVPGAALRGAAGSAGAAAVLEADADVALPPVERVSFGTAPGKADVVKGGVPNAEFGATAGPFTDLVPSSHAARTTRVSVGGAGAAGAVCDPVTEPADDGHGSTRVWYQCRARGVCEVVAFLHTAPQPVTLTWKHACGGQGHPGANLGSKETLADVAKAGVVQGAWDGEDPAVTVPPEQSVSSLFLQPKAGQPDVFTRPLQLTAEPADVVRFYGYGTLDREQRPFYRRHGVSNIALFRPVNKSSHLCGHYGRRAVDGLTVGDDEQLYVAMTGNHGADPQPWLEVDLGARGARSDIMEVHLWNRGDGGPAITSRNFPCWVMLFDGDEPPPRDLGAARRVAVAETKLTRDKRLSVWRLEAPVRARWARVQLERTTYLQLAEFEVYAATGDARCPRPLPPAVRADPVCYRATATAPVHSDLVYECLRPGETKVTATLPLYPQWGPYNPLRASWRKQCTNARHPKLAVGTSPEGSSEIVRMGVTQPAFVPMEDPTVEWMGGTGVFESAAEGEGSLAGGSLESVADSLAHSGHLHTVDGSEVETVLYPHMSAIGSSVDIAEPQVTLSKGADKIMAPALFGRLSKGGRVMDELKTLRLRYGCKQAGEGVVTVAFRTVPHLQPYGPVAFAVRKVCGGRRVDMDVYRPAEEEGGKEEEEGEGAGPEATPSVTQGGRATSAYYTETQTATGGPSAITPGLTGPAATGGASAPYFGDAEEGEIAESSGTALEGAGSEEEGAGAAASAARLAHVVTAKASGGEGGGEGSGSAVFNHKPGMVVPESEDSTTFFLAVPPTEEEMASGVGQRQPTECAGDSSRNCTQVAADGAGVHAWCSPNICASGSLGMGRGPEIGGEVVGEPGERASPSDKPSLVLTYHCTGIGSTVVTVQVYPSAFNDPVEFSFTKECHAWEATWWGRSALFLAGGGVLAAVGFGVYASGLHSKVAQAVGLGK